MNVVPFLRSLCVSHAHTFLSDGSANIHIRSFVFDVLSQSEDILQLGVSLLQIDFRHLKETKTVNILIVTSSL